MKEALKKLNETRFTAENAFPSDPRVRAGWEMMRRQAQADLPTIQAAFDTAFKKVGFPVFLMGPATEDFIRLAEEEAEIVVVRGVLGELRDAVRANVNRSGEFSVSAFTALIRELRQLGAKLGMTSLPSPEFIGEEYVGQDDAKLDAVINRYLQKTVGPDFLAAIIEQEACRKAEALTGDQPVVPVVILGMSPEVATSLGSKVFGKPSLQVVTPETVDADFVTDQFKTIRSTLKTKKK